MERCIRNRCNALRCSAEFLHSAQQKQTLKFQTMETAYENLRFRSKNSMQLTWSTIEVSPIMRRFLFLHNKRNTRFETEDFATLVMYGLCRMYKPQMKADKGSSSRGGHSKNPCICPSIFKPKPPAPKPGRRAPPPRRPISCRSPVHTGTQTQIRCWNCCQSRSQSRLETDSPAGRCGQ